ncbi:hypothetical protein Sjap_025317 [Stephania japonica]|uniref:Cysteine-rich receptor-like protein kinase 10 n=1 Tax=Stephania japonica TaxID=461633 RepID=A0AAP0E1L5_9MAGN
MTFGQDPDRIYGAFMCRGDVSPQSCKACVDLATSDVITRCPNKKESVIWFDNCMLRYSNQSFFSSMQTSPRFYMWNTQNASDPNEFNRVLGNLMSSLAEEAANGGGSSSSRAMFKTKQVELNSFQKIYGLVQCTPDLSPGDCYSCLTNIITEIPACCNRKQGGRVISVSCNLRFEIYPFYARDDSPAPSPPLLPLPPSTNSTTPEGKGKNSARVVILAVIPSAIAAVVICAVVIFLCKTKRRPNQTSITAVYSSQDEEITTVESLQFTMEILRAATNNFSEANKLGEGGFGPVYKGQLSNGQKIAVKRLSRQSGQGEVEFKNEVVLVAKLQHRNLVRLLGFCFQGEEKLLIYEFVPNMSLDRFIYDPHRRADLNWERRHRIIVGIARGILYLHEDSRHRIIHRDLKLSNILLDAEMDPKISDFGMARLVMDQTQGSTTSLIAGTYGYMAPEYAMCGRFSVKSDVFSFGVILLEIVTGQKISVFLEPEHGENLLSYAWRLWNEGRALQLIDPTLRGICLPNEVVRCIHIGLLCVQENVADRPTMGSVVVLLTSGSISLALASRPAFFANSRIGSSFVSNVDKSHSHLNEPEQVAAANSPYSVNDMSITELYPR